MGWSKSTAMSVLIQTSIGNIVIDLYTKEAPTLSLNFIKLCKEKYFTFAPFYNIQRDFIAEIGDPAYPKSQSGESIWSLLGLKPSPSFSVEHNKLKNTKKGAVCAPVVEHAGQLIASGPITTITLTDLDPSRYATKSVVFGQVVEGFEVLDKMNKTIVDESYRPYQDIRIHHVYILDDPFDELEEMKCPATPEPTETQLSTVRLDDTLSLDVDKDEEEPTEEQIKERKKREIESKALTLEIMGDLPSAEVKPMENVLFVCKLNPLTRDEDLEIIFSRFGKILSCEIIRDKQTGESMQYAFIEYADKRSCETAYFKMDGVLIDDRRVHVDFSQSVSKLADAWRGVKSETRPRQRTERRRDDLRDNSRHDRRSDRRDDRRSDHRDNRNADRYRSHRSRDERDRDHHRSPKDRDRDYRSHRDDRRDRDRNRDHHRSSHHHSSRRDYDR